MKQLWNDQRSILLTRAVVALAIAGSVVMTVCGPKITHWMVTAHGLPPRSGPLLLGMGYACAALALVMLCSLYQFLRRIEAGEVFVSTNVAALRCLSWCCAGAAGFCLLAAGIYLPFLFLAVAAGFMALIVRVLKESNGVVAGPKGAAQRLGLKRTTLLSRMKRLGINKDELV